MFRLKWNNRVKLQSQQVLSKKLVEDFISVWKVLTFTRLQNWALEVRNIVRASSKQWKQHAERHNLICCYVRDLRTSTNESRVSGGIWTNESHYEERRLFLRYLTISEPRSLRETRLISSPLSRQVITSQIASASRLELKHGSETQVIASKKLCLNFTHYLFQLLIHPVNLIYDTILP